jgi:hypothetical protein
MKKTALNMNRIIVVLTLVAGFALAGCVDEHRVRDKGTPGASSCAEVVSLRAQVCDYSSEGELNALRWCESEEGPGNPESPCAPEGGAFLDCLAVAPDCGASQCDKAFDEFVGCLDEWHPEDRDPSEETDGERWEVLGSMDTAVYGD